MSSTRLASLKANSAGASAKASAAAKFAIVGMTYTAAKELAPFGITVNCLQPGVIRSDMTAPVQEKYDRMIADGLLPEARWGEPEDVGRAVAMLARGDLTYATGQVLHVDGGLGIQRL